MFDGIPPILKNAFIAVNVADFGGGADGVHVARIIDSEGLVILAFDFAEILGVHVERIFGFLDANLVVFTGSVVCDFEVLALHHLHFLFPQSQR